MRTRILVLLGLLLAFDSSASSGVPSPFNSTVPNCLVSCPMGDIPFTVVVRDLANNPVSGSTVVLDFSNCPGAYLCRTRSSDPYNLDLPTRTIRQNTDANGVVTLPLRVGGVCGGQSSVRIYADGVFLASRALASPDQDGNGVVMDPDYLILSAKVGGSDPTADLDCDGSVTAADQIVQGNRHGSHSCDGIVNPVHPRTWGALKAHYR